MMFALARRLRQNGVLGINRRNAEFVLPYNERRFYPRVDDKLRTKRIAEKAGIAVPPLLGVVEIAWQVRDLPALLARHDEFVVKPAEGSGGNGILVIVGRSRNLYQQANGKLIDQAELDYHVNLTLSGIHSLGGQPDKVLIEGLVHFDPVFQAITYEGVPDIRIIVFLGVPVMAMVRLPTRLSGGRANLHQGAIGAGVDLASGTTLTAVLRNDIVAEHPDTGNPVSGVTIPYWDTMLELAARSTELTELGYQGIDIVLDRDRGPLVLELNARPGLNIQIANRAGLAGRLQSVQEHIGAFGSIEDRIAFAKANFRAAAARASSTALSEPGAANPPGESG